MKNVFNSIKKFDGNFDSYMFMHYAFAFACLYEFWSFMFITVL